MQRFCLLILLVSFIFESFAYSQVKVRLFSLYSPEQAVFKVMTGEYQINAFDGNSMTVTEGEPVIISRYSGRLAVKSRNYKGFICDSVEFKTNSVEGLFSLSINVKSVPGKFYSGDLKCLSDLGTVLLINNVDIERYIAGVVRTEGGTGKGEEFFKTQAVIVRTYMYKYFDKHLPDGYNLCDNTHCQAYNGISNDEIIDKAVRDTHNEVILDSDSTLVIAAFHSNCGGETCSSEDVWLTSQPYLKKVIDPFCLLSRNAKWEKSYSKDEWIDVLKKTGYTGREDDPSIFSFYQRSRLTELKCGAVSIPLTTIRAELNLRSAFFSVIPNGDSVIFRGRGYGHGVGLCQEGAMVMAEKGYTYKKIIDYYYYGVILTDVKNAVILP